MEGRRRRGGRTRRAPTARRSRRALGRIEPGAFATVVRLPLGPGPPPARLTVRLRARRRAAGGRLGEAAVCARLAHRRSHRLPLGAADRDAAGRDLRVRAQRAHPRRVAGARRRSIAAKCACSIGPANRCRWSCRSRKTPDKKAAGRRDVALGARPRRLPDRAHGRRRRGHRRSGCLRFA